MTTYCSDHRCYETAANGTTFCSSHSKPTQASGVTHLVPAAHAGSGSKQTYTVALQVPATNYWLSIREVREGNDAVYVLSRVGSDGFGGMAITSLSQKVEGEQATQGKPIRQLLLGKTWNWGDDAFEAFDTEESLPTDFRAGRALFVNNEPTP